MNSSHRFLGNNLFQSDETHPHYPVRDSANNAEQVRIAHPVPGLYEVQIRGVDVLNGPQAFALVASAGELLFVPSAMCPAPECLNNCSDRGICRASGICDCPPTHGGHDCSREYKVLDAAPGSISTMSVTWMGMSYYTFSVPANRSFVLFLTPNQAAGADADFYLAKGRLPQRDEYDAAAAGQSSSAVFWTSSSFGSGQWTLGLLARSGNVNILANLTICDYEDCTAIAGGDSGGGDGGSDSEDGVCAAPCECGTMTAESGQFSDGDGYYADNNWCWWTIAPAGVDNVTLTFTSASVEENYDFIEVYECQDPS